MNENEPEGALPEEATSQESLDFVHLFEEMTDLLQYALENADKSLKVPLTKNLEDQMLKLERDVEDFCKLNAAVNSSLQKPEIDPLLTMSKRERAVYDRSKKLVSRAEEKIAIIKDFLRSAATKGIQIEKSPEERKKDFKRYGQREKWKKM